MSGVGRCDEIVRRIDEVLSAELVVVEPGEDWDWAREVGLPVGVRFGVRDFPAWLRV